MNEVPPRSAPLGGTRYCRAVRRRGAVPRTRIRVVHYEAGVALAHRPTATAQALPRRSRAPLVTLTLAVMVLVGGIAGLLKGPPPVPERTGSGCPPRDSQAVAVDGRTLRLRPGPSRGGSALLHLCADETTGRVVRWAVMTGHEGFSCGVTAVGTTQALASIPLAPDGSAAVTVEIETDTGTATRFSAKIRGVTK